MCHILPPDGVVAWIEPTVDAVFASSLTVNL